MDQTMNSDCDCCKCCVREQDKDCCFASWSNNCEMLITDYESNKQNSDFLCTCLCTLLCIGPKLLLLIPFIPFTCYNCIRNTYKKTINTNYIC